MKIDFSSAVQQTQTELNEKFFSISDPAFIFDLLRNKIYSNPIMAVCRELSCNALDAHREVGKGDEPIVINLPSKEDPYFKVRDFGPGISPSRIDDIYLKYAASTKRDSNDQIGAFGIGAKSPFSYSDSFTIVTNHEGKCYNYMAFIDESRMGKLILLSESDTADSNGTEIIVPVKSEDIYSFYDNIEKCTRHWLAKPKFTNGKISHRKVNAVVGNDDWFLSDDRENYYERKVKVLVGEIEYNLDSSALKTFCDVSILSLVGSDVYIRFNVGDISLAANRESVYLDQSTKEKISNRMSSIKSHYISMIRDRINSQETYWHACSFVNNELSSICQNPSMLNPITWNGKEVITKIHSNENFYLWSFKQVKDRWSDKVKIQRRSVGAIPVNLDSKIIIHDCGSSDPTARHLKQFFVEDPNSIFYVVHPRNVNVENFDIQSLIESEGFGLFEHQLLSKHNKQIRSKKQSEKTKLMIYKMDAYGSFTNVPHADTVLDTNKKLVVYLKKDSFRNKKYPLDTEKNHLDQSKLKAVLELDKNVSIYGVDENIEESRIFSTLTGASFVSDYIDDWVSNLDQEAYFQYRLAQKEISDYNRNCTFSDIFNHLKDKVSSSSPILTLTSHYDSISNTLADGKNTLNMVYSLGVDVLSAEKFNEIQNSKSKIVDMYNNLMARYPLLNALEKYKCYNYIDNIAHYINVVDSSLQTS